MFKKLKYFALFFTLQLSEYVYAYGAGDRISSITIASLSKHFSLFSSTDHDGSFIKNSQHDDSEHIKFFLEERTEETLRPILKKTYNTGSQFFAFACTQKSNFFFGRVKNHIPLSTHWFYCSSYRYIFLQVMRI